MIGKRQRKAARVMWIDRERARMASDIRGLGVLSSPGPGAGAACATNKFIRIILAMRCLSPCWQPFRAENELISFDDFEKACLMMVLDHSVVPAVVLVVEDEMMLRMRAVDMVEDAGYTSIEAVDADEAVAILESRSDIALIFTDIQMPGSMDGLKLAHTVRERWPPIKIILVSGQLKPANSDIPAESRFYGKPLEAKEMIAELQSMIGHA
jgi:CheY-like chemotaxis protein